MPPWRTPVPERVAGAGGAFERVSTHAWVAVTGPRASALLEEVALGTLAIRLDGVPWTGSRGWCPPGGLVFPHLSVRETLGYAGVPRAEVARVGRALGLTDVLDRRPRSVSAGERAATALGRALLASPRLWLLDVPFAEPAPLAFVREERDRVGAVVLGVGLPDPEDVWDTGPR